MPRRIVAILAKTKNDRNGTGPVAGRTYVLPCICMESLESKEERNNWAKALKKEPFCKCISACPFATVVKYMMACPKLEATSSEGPLSFMRAITARGGDNRRLLTSKLGINQAKKCLEKVFYFNN